MKKKDLFQNMALILVLVIGLSLLLYPTVSNWWNDKVQTKAVANFQSQMAVVDNSEYEAMWQAALDYNEKLLRRSNPYALPDEMESEYYTTMNVTGNGIMGYVEIPSIKITLPMYHGTSETVLATSIGHLDWTSLPTGGPSTHCVLSGHRGLPSARLFTDLDKLAVGDIFIIHAMDETLTYEVDQIKIVEPHESEDLVIQEGKDLVTLVTCTPYGVNSHRLLVRGHRVENLAETTVVRVTADAVIVEKLIVAPFLLVPMLLVFLIIIAIPNKKNRRKEK